MTVKSPLGMLGVAFLGLSVIGCGGFGGLGAKSGKANSKKACASFSKDYHSVDEALAALSKLNGRAADSNSHIDAFTAFIDFLAATGKFSPELVLDRMDESVKSAVTELHDSLKRVQDDLDTNKHGSKPDIQAALNDGPQVSSALAGLKSACGQS